MHLNVYPSSHRTQTCSSPPKDSLAESNFLFLPGLARPLLSLLSVLAGLRPCPTATNQSCRGLRLNLSRIGDALLPRLLLSLPVASLTTIIERLDTSYRPLAVCGGCPALGFQRSFVRNLRCELCTEEVVGTMMGSPELALSPRVHE